MGIKPPTLDFEKKGIYKHPLKIRINKRLEQSTDAQWWEKIVAKTRKERSEKVGKLRDKTINSHESYHKYPD